MKYMITNTKSHPTIAVSLLLPVFLGACTTFSAIALPEVRGQNADTTRISQGACSSTTDRTEPLVASGVLLPILFDQAAAFAESSLKEKKKRFTATYSAKVTLDELRPGECIRLTRSQKGTALSDVELKIVDRRKNSAELAVENFDLNGFTASTSANEGKLSASVSISAAIHYVNPKGFDGPTPITQITLPIAAGKYTLGDTSTNSLKRQKSPLFPILKATPVNFAISITEIGQGNSELTAGLEGFDANASALKKVLGLED